MIWANIRENILCDGENNKRFRSLGRHINKADVLVNSGRNSFISTVDEDGWLCYSINMIMKDIKREREVYLYG